MIRHGKTSRENRIQEKGKRQENLIETRLPVIALRASNQGVIREVQRIADLAAVDIRVFTNPSNQVAVLNLVEVQAPVPKVAASFHPSYAPYFVQGRIEITLPEQAEELLELLLAAGTTRRGKVVGVVGAQGGVGVSITAAWIARILARYRNICLVDADPVSSGNDWLVGLAKEAGMRWADIRDEAGAPVPRRLKEVLPHVERLRVLSADSRGGMPSNEAGVRVLSALSQVHDVCLVDFSPQALIRGGIGYGLLDWVDSVVVVGRSGIRGHEALRTALRRIPQGIEVQVLILGATRGECAAVALEARLPSSNVWPLRRMRALEADFEHGVRAGDRRRCSLELDLRPLAKVLV